LRKGGEKEVEKVRGVHMSPSNRKREQTDIIAKAKGKSDTKEEKRENDDLRPRARKKNYCHKERKGSYRLEFKPKVKKGIKNNGEEEKGAYQGGGRKVPEQRRRSASILWIPRREGSKGEIASGLKREKGRGFVSIYVQRGKNRMGRPQEPATADTSGRKERTSTIPV